MKSMKLSQVLSALTAVALTGAVSVSQLPAASAADVDPAAAKPAAPAKPAPAKPAAPKALTIDPSSLRNMIVHNNFGVITQLNLIHQAKDVVDVARGNLLPSVNLGAIAGAASGSFALSSITFLLPFLLPSNWANLHQSEDLLESQKVGFRLVELNNYASAYSLYETMLSDQAVRDTLVTQYNDLVYIRDWLISQRPFKGTITQGDVDNADGQVNTAQANIATQDQLLVTERAQLGLMLALPNDNITLANVHIPASPAESQSLNTVVAKIQKLAPENLQIVDMIEAAKQAKISKEFGFLGGASLDLASSSGGSFNLSGVSGNLQFNISFALIPTVQLAEDQVGALQIEEKQLLASELEIGQQTLGSVVHAQTQIASNLKASNDYTVVAQEYFLKYTLGRTDLTNVFQQEQLLAQAKAAQVKAQLDLDQLRVTLHRELLTDQFASIPGCKIRPEAEQLDAQWLGNFLGGLFDPAKDNLSIDQACMPAN